MVLAAALSVQFGAALGATLFDTLGPGGASLLRQAFAAVILLALWRPRPRDYDAAALRLPPRLWPPPRARETGVFPGGAPPPPFGGVGPPGLCPRARGGGG